MKNIEADVAISDIILRINSLLKRQASPKTIGARIAHIRRERKMTQQQLSNAILKRYGFGPGDDRSYFVSRSAIANIETGRDLSLKLLSLVARELNVSRAYLLGDGHDFFSLTQEEKRLVIALRILKSNNDIIY